MTGSPDLPPRLTLTLPEDVSDKVRELAKKDGIEPRDWVLRLVYVGLHKHRGQPPPPVMF